MATTAHAVRPTAGLAEMASRLATSDLVHSSRYQLGSRLGVSNNKLLKIRLFSSLYTLLRSYDTLGRMVITVCGNSLVLYNATTVIFVTPERSCEIGRNVGNILLLF